MSESEYQQIETQQDPEITKIIEEIKKVQSNYSMYPYDKSFDVKKAFIVNLDEYKNSNRSVDEWEALLESEKLGDSLFANINTQCNAWNWSLPNKSKYNIFKVKPESRYMYLHKKIPFGDNNAVDNFFIDTIAKEVAYFHEIEKFDKSRIHLILRNFLLVHKYFVEAGYESLTENLESTLIAEHIDFDNKNYLEIIENMTNNMKDALPQEKKSHVDDVINKRLEKYKKKKSITVEQVQVPNTVEPNIKEVILANQSEVSKKLGVNDGYLITKEKLDSITDENQLQTLKQIINLQLAIIDERNKHIEK